MLLRIKASTAWRDRLEPKMDLVLYALPVQNLSTVFRVYVHSGAVVLIAQVFLSDVFDFLLQRPESASLVHAILRFFEAHAPALVPADVRHAVLDLYIHYGSDEIYLLGVTPWHYPAENLFDWAEINEFALTGSPLAHDASTAVEYFGPVALAFLTSRSLCRRPLFGVRPEDVEELARITCT